ncbi:MAG: hypothetical protein JNL41_05290 [Phenylobacterium sp.]|uniref:hypothetical protein n=1 Tax=Phenylobacterium sp. TaxID=1871053 RepID=UPI001A46605E|nr:hypothetical protein [Phenylobacterium sp.]MBL8553672.1 hypothetical protein [Phenylobacterium sp.]
MQRTALILAAAAALCAPAAPAAAQSPADSADVRCLMVLQVVGRDPKQAEQAAKGIFFYLGRLSARGPVSRLEPLLKAEAMKLTPAQGQVELTRCGGELNGRGGELQAVNRRLAASVAPKPPPAKK